MSSVAPPPALGPATAPSKGSSMMPLIIGVVVLLLCAAYYFMNKKPVVPVDTPVVAPPPVTAAPVAAAASLAFNPTAAASYVGPSTGSEYPGSDLGNFSNPDPNFCADKCNNTPNCTGFVVSSTGQGCYIKSAFVSPVASTTSSVYVKPGTILPDAASKYQPPIVGKYNGNELANFTNTDPNFCASKCNSTQGCVAFQVDATSCILKSRLTEPLDATQTDTKVYKKIGTSSTPAASPGTSQYAVEAGTHSNIGRPLQPV